MPNKPRSSRVALVLVVIILISATGAPIVSATEQVIGQPDIDVSAPDPHITAGEETTLELYLTNTGQVWQSGPSEYVNRVTTARGTTVELNSQNSPIDIQTEQIPVGQVGPGTTGPLNVRLTVPEDTTAGTYEIPVNVRYSYTNIINYGNGQPEFVNSFSNSEQTITIQVEEDARFEIVETDATTQVGADSDITYTLKNNGSEIARGASVNAESQSNSLTFESGDTSSTASVGDWEPGEVRTVSYNAALDSDAPVRGYSVNLAVNYDDIDGISRVSDSITTTVQSNPEQAFTLTDVESQLRVAENGDLIGTVRNDGPLPARSVVVQYTGSGQSVIPTERSTAVGTLDPGQSENFSLPIAISSGAEAGMRSLDMAVQYRNSAGETRTFEDLAVDAEIAPKRDRFDVTVENRTIQAGGARSVDIAVTNNLNEVASDVDVRLFADDPLDTGDTDTGYVQSLDPGETKTVTLELTTTGSATVGSTYPVSLDFRYDDTDGDSHLTDTYRVPIDVTESEESGLPLPIIAVALLVIGTGALVIYRRRQ